MNTKLFLDDERFPPNDGGDWLIVRSSEEACFWCKHSVPSYISFDHDLGGNDTAMVFVKWMIEQDIDRPGFIPYDFTYYVHSQNPIGRDAIIGLIENYLRHR